MFFRYIHTLKKKKKHTKQQNNSLQYVLRGYSGFSKMLLGIKYWAGMTHTWFQFLESSLWACSFLPWDTLVIPVASRATSCSSRQSRQLREHPSPSSSRGCSCSCKGSKCWPCCSLGCWSWPGMEQGVNFDRSKVNRTVLMTRAPWQSAFTSSVGKLMCTLRTPWASG